MRCVIKLSQHPDMLTSTCLSLIRFCIMYWARSACDRRAGRDGALAWAILYYTYADAKVWRSLLQKSAEENHSPPEQLQCNMDSLNAMVSPSARLFVERAAGPASKTVAGRCASGPALTLQ